jgi:hypothetical protein
LAFGPEGRLVWRSGEENRNDGQLAFDHLADAGADLGFLPGPHPVVAHAHRGGRGFKEGFLDLVLPGYSGTKSVKVEPGNDFSGAQKFRDFPDSGLVLAVIAQEDIVDRSHDR